MFQVRSLKSIIYQRPNHERGAEARSIEKPETQNSKPETRN